MNSTCAALQVKQLPKGLHLEVIWVVPVNLPFSLSVFCPLIFIAEQSK